MPFPCSDIKLAQMNKAQVRKYVQVPSNLCVRSNPIINFHYKRGHRQELSIFLNNDLHFTQQSWVKILTHPQVISNVYVE